MATSSKVAPKTPSKMCVRCNRILPMTSFYSNRKWKDQRLHDAWCKECANKFCCDIQTLKQYCYENNRRWLDSAYDAAVNKAKYFLATDKDFLNPRISQKRKDEMVTTTACRQFFSVMNMVAFYSYVDNVHSDDFAPDNLPEEEEEDKSSSDNAPLVYDKTWRGKYTQEQLDALNETYAKYEDDFVLDNISLQDYARKVAKASLNADIAEDKMRRGVGTVQEYREAQKIFDDLSKSSNFAACRRKPGESVGYGSLGEIISKIELSGEIDKVQVQFPKDDIDHILDEYYHTFQATGYGNGAGGA